MMACKKNDVKRSRPSAHKRLVRTKRGAKVVVVNRHIRKKKVVRAGRLGVAKSKRIVPMGSMAGISISSKPSVVVTDPSLLLEEIKSDAENKVLTKTHRDTYDPFAKRLNKASVEKNLKEADSAFINLGYSDYMDVVRISEEERQRQEKEKARIELAEKLYGLEKKEEIVAPIDNDVTFKVVRSEKDFDAASPFVWSGVRSSGFEPLNLEKSKKIRGPKK